MKHKPFLIGLTYLVIFFGFNSVVIAGAVTSKEELTISTTGGGIKIKSNNGNTFKFGGFIQYDFDGYDGLYNASTGSSNGDSANESEWRRTRITASGTRGEKN